jgi:hypothetical protein
MLPRIDMSADMIEGTPAAFIELERLAAAAGGVELDELASMLIGRVRSSA